LQTSQATKIETTPLFPKIPKEKKEKEKEP